MAPTGEVLMFKKVDNYNHIKPNMLHNMLPNYANMMVIKNISSIAYLNFIEVDRVQIC